MQALVIYKNSIYLLPVKTSQSKTTFGKSRFMTINNCPNV